MTALLNKPSKVIRKKPSKPTSRELVKRLLSDCVIDPNKPGPWSAIMESVGPSYIEAKLLELASSSMKLMNNPKRAPTMAEYKTYDDLMKQIVEFATLARIERGSYHADKSNEYTVVVTAMKLVAGEIAVHKATVTSADYQTGTSVETSTKAPCCDVCQRAEPLKKYKGQSSSANGGWIYTVRCSKCVGAGWVECIGDE